MSGPHDRLIRETFARPHAAAWLLRHTLRPLSSTAPPTPLPDAALVHGRERRADLAFDLIEHQLRVFVEHQSSPRADMALRCHEHLVIATRAARNEDPSAVPPRVHIVVLFQGPGRWAPTTTLARQAPALPARLATMSLAPAYDVWHLEDLPLGDAPADARVAVRLLLRVANAPAHSSPWGLTDDELRDLQRVRHKLGSSAIYTLIGYLSSISATLPPEALMAQLQHQHPELAEDFVSYADQLRLEGERIGEARAAKQHAAQLKRERERLARLHEGRLRSERVRAENERVRAAAQQCQLLIQLATERLGPPSDAQRERAAQLHAAQVHAAMTRLLSASGWDALLG